MTQSEIQIKQVDMETNRDNDTTYNEMTNEELISEASRLRYEQLRIDENDPTTRDRAINAKKTLHQSVNSDFFNGLVTREELIKELREVRQRRQ